MLAARHLPARRETNRMQLNIPKLDTLPRVPLGEYPTPLEYLTRLSASLGVEVYMKRDDQSGPLLGGSATRALEYELGYARRKHAARIVTFDSLSSTHACLTAAAARRLGMEPHLFYFAPRPERLEGNLLLNRVLNAQMHFVPFGKGGDGSATIERTMRLAQLVALAKVGKHYFIPTAGHSVRGALGYVRAALELDAQANELGIPNAWVVLAAGTGGAPAGLLAGLTLAESKLRLLAVDIGRLWKNFAASLAHLATEVCQFLDMPHAFKPADVPLLEGRYAGQAYAMPSDEGNAAILTLARAEGILLDPICTGKAFAGLLDLTRRKVLGTDAPIIFLHTGGAPTLFAHARSLAQAATAPT